MQHQDTTPHRAEQIASECIAEAAAFAPNSPDWLYRHRAAWKLEQMADGIPARDWTETPPGGFNCPVNNPAHRMAAE